jgi:L-ascorbate metabolism protein UlaG (beta-lactamase superfamily)
MKSKHYLRPNTVIEPLIGRWYAWSHLVSPATASLNITGRHNKIMNSYIQAPHIHAAAVKNEQMRGGPFMDYKTNRANDVRELRDNTMKSQANLIEFASALKELDRMLKANAKGFSLEPLYEKVPPILRGFVELVYDLNNNPSYRIIEPLLYNSKYYQPDMQSVNLWITNNDERPFCLSTARLQEEDAIHLDIPFNHPFIDKLASMKRNAGDIDELLAMLPSPIANIDLFRSFFSEEANPPYEKYHGDKVRMRYFGHACILIETSEISILIDPLISYYGYPSTVAHYSDMHLPEVIDFVLITHNHQDHILFETLLPLRHKIKNIIVPRSNGGALQDPSLKLMFEKIGFNSVIEIDELQTHSFGKCSITGLPFTGEHSDLNIRSKICYLICIGEFSILFAADSRILEPAIYRNVQNIYGDIDVIFLGMECDGAPLSWLYGPLLTEELPRDKDVTRRLSGSNYEKGITLVDIFNPKEVYVYAMGQEPWVEFISSIKYTDESNPIVASKKLINECQQRGIIAERLFGEKELFYQHDLAQI